MDAKKIWVLIIGIILVFAVTSFILVHSIQNSINKTIAPVQSMTNNISTSVAEMLNPTPTFLPDPVTIIHEVRSLARLETIQYSMEKVITAETSQGPFGFLFGDRLLLVAHGYVIAGIDLSKLTPEDLSTKNGVLYVNLPEPEIFVATLDNSKTYVYDRDKGLLTKGDLQLEAGAREIAEQEIKKSAIEDGILGIAEQNAESFLYNFIKHFGYNEIIFK